jgi:hypothetical protein
VNAFFIYLCAMQDISLQKYFALSNRIPYDSVLRHAKPKNLLSGKAMNVNTMTYKEVRICLELIRKGESVEQLQDLFCLAFGINPEEFMGASVKEFFPAQNHLIKTFEDLQKRESKLLTSIDSDSALWELAGGDKLNKFSNLMPLVQLGEIYHIFPYDLEDRKYAEILTLLVLHKEKADVQKAYSKLKTDTA